MSISVGFNSFHFYLGPSMNAHLSPLLQIQEQVYQIRTKLNTSDCIPEEGEGH